MSVMANKKPPENKVNSERIVDFSGGLNTTINGSLLNSNEAQISTNVSYSQKGTLAPRRGRKKRYATNFSDSPVTGLARYYKKDGTTYLVSASDSTLYYDTPNLSQKWSSQEDFEADNTSRSAWLDTSSQAENIMFKRNLMTGTGACETVFGWTFIDLLAEADATEHQQGAKSLKLTLSPGKTIGYATYATSNRSPCCFSAYIKNSTVATDGIRLVALNASGGVVKGATYVAIGTTWVLNVLKLSATDLATVVSVGIEVKGTAAAQLGYVDAVVLNYITEFSVTDNTYVPPTYDSLEVANKAITYLENKTAAIGTSFSDNISTVSDFTNPLNEYITIVGDECIIVDTHLTFVPYASMTFDQLIAL